jgi:hypothetical protein
MEQVISADTCAKRHFARLYVVLKASGSANRAVCKEETRGLREADQDREPRSAVVRGRLSGVRRIGRLRPRPNQNPLHHTAPEHIAGKPTPVDLGAARFHLSTRTIPQPARPPSTTGDCAKEGALCPCPTLTGRGHAPATRIPRLSGASAPQKRSARGDCTCEKVGGQRFHPSRLLLF